MHVFVEGYGCSLNRSDTEQVQGFLESQGFILVEKPENAGLIVINTCAVKEQTETKMLRRIKELNAVAKKGKAVLVVFGCLPKINSKAIADISEKIVQLGPSLEELASFLQLPPQKFSPELEEKKSSSIVSIIPIARGCLGNCSYCSVRSARGSLKSYSVSELNKKFKKAIKGSKEIWLTAQDCGCYGFDIGTNLAELLKELLKSEGEFRIRIGMANPGHLKKFLKEYLELFEDKRLYRFFHIPVQSGSNSVLRQMNRGYKKEDFLEIVKVIRNRFPNATISTDIIVGFPGESEDDFKQTLFLVKEAKPDTVNISRFGARPSTLAEKMPVQLHGRVKKKRSRELTLLCKEIALERNKGFVGLVQKILVNEKGKGNTFVGRTQDCKPVAVKENLFGKFAKVKITKALSTHLLGKVIK